MLYESDGRLRSVLSLGINIVRAFITFGPGGVGQSLNTCLVEDMFGHMQVFMIMIGFCTEDELRKQAETYTGKV